MVSFAAGNRTYSSFSRARKRIWKLIKKAHVASGMFLDGFAPPGAWIDYVLSKLEEWGALAPEDRETLRVAALSQLRSVQKPSPMEPVLFAAACVYRAARGLKAAEALSPKTSITQRSLAGAINKVEPTVRRAYLKVFRRREA